MNNNELSKTIVTHANLLRDARNVVLGVSQTSRFLKEIWNFFKNYFFKLSSIKGLKNNNSILYNKMTMEGWNSTFALSKIFI